MSATIRPPLVEPATADLNRDEIERYQRHLSLPGFGVEAQRRLRNARVLVVGAGGLGAPVLQYLAAAGVGTIGIVDDDLVDTSNLQRQIIHGTDDVGRPKVDSAAEAVARINPFVTVHTHQVRLDADNVVQLLTGYDLVLDGADNFATRYLVSDAAELAGKPVVWGSILRFFGQVSVFWYGHGPTYRDLYPEPPEPGAIPSCAEGGVLGVLPAVVGSLMATEAIKLIAGIGEVLIGRLLLYDAQEATFRTVTVGADPARPRVTAIVPVEAVCAAPAATQDHQDTIAADELARQLAEPDVDSRMLVVDVREDWERALSAIPGSVHVPLGHVMDEGMDALPTAASDRDLVLYCKAGIRSEVALRRLAPEVLTTGHRLRHLEGGIEAWAALLGRG